MTHRHWTYKIGQYRSPLSWPSREAAEAALGQRMFYTPTPELIEGTVDCADQNCQDGGFRWTAE